MLRIAVPGAAGKMGQAIVRVVAETGGARLSAALERPGHARLGEDAGVVAGLGALGVPLSESIEAALRESDVLIDFTVPAATAALTPAAAARGVAIVVGTTGLGEAEREIVARAAERVPVVFSPNFSVGVNVLLGLVDMATRALGDAYDVEIVEAHHRLKRDAPSGTALKIAEVIAQALGRDLAEAGVWGRQGNVGPRTGHEIGVFAVRGGDVVGDHTAHFLGLGDRIEITHRASSRDTFAQGAVRAARWLAGRAPGLYDMRDVLELKK